MTPFVTLDAVAAPLPDANVDTDQIIPARFLRKPRSAGYRNFLFADVRKAGFVLDRPEWAGAGILVAGPNFGCGSSREAAVYALVDAGIRCVVAPSFGDIFAGNAGKNGLLALTLPEATVGGLLDRLVAAPGTRLAVDLPAQTVTEADGTVHSFEIDAFRKQGLIDGRDDVDVTLVHAETIAAWEASDRNARPWA